MSRPMTIIRSILGMAAFMALASPVTAAIPDIKKLLANFPAGSAEDVKKRIGGGVNASWITNTATIRISRAFNYSGAPIPAGPADKAPGMHTVLGGDKLNYAYRVGEMKTWLISTYGQPALSFKAGPYGTAPKALAGRGGIIVFVDCGWSDASGHIDLWDGTKAAGHAYFELCKQVYLWESKAAAQAARTAVTTAQVNVRAGPSSSAQILGSLNKGTVVNLVGNAPTNNFWSIGNGQYVPASYLKIN